MKTKNTLSGIIKKYFNVDNVEYTSSWSGIHALIDNKLTSTKMFLGVIFLTMLMKDLFKFPEVNLQDLDL